jgi:hypothetical protein
MVDKLENYLGNNEEDIDECIFVDKVNILAGMINKINNWRMLNKDTYIKCIVNYPTKNIQKNMMIHNHSFV